MVAAALLLFIDSTALFPWQGGWRPVPAPEQHLIWKRGPWNLHAGALLLQAAWTPNWIRAPNTGPVWLGRGASALITGGFTFSGPWLAVQLDPILWASENRFIPSPAWFRTDPRLPPGWDMRRRLDLRLRPADEPLWRLDVGEKSLRAGPSWLGLQASSRSLWWGVGRRTSILAAPNAPGFARLGFEGRLRLPVSLGVLAYEYAVGRLMESRGFDRDSSNDRRYWIGLRLEWRFGPLLLGAGRVAVDYWPRGGAIPLDLVLQNPLKRFISTPEEPEGPYRTADQMASLWWEWRFPRAQLALYGEWGKADHSWDFLDLFLEPEHASSYLFGLEKTWGSPSGPYALLQVELVHLELPRTALVRGGVPFYIHGAVRHGYTHRGRLLGSDVGVNGNLQAVRYVRIGRFHSWGLALERRLPDVDRFYGLRHRPSVQAPELFWIATFWIERPFNSRTRLGLLLSGMRQWNRDYRHGEDTSSLLFSTWIRYRPW